MRTDNVPGFSIASVLLVVLWAGIASLLMSSTPAQAQRREPASIQIERIALLPFFKGSLSSSVQESLECPLCNLTIGMEDMEPDADQVLTRIVQRSLEKRYYDRVVPSLKVLAAYMDVPKDEAKDTPLILARKTGRAMEVSHIMAGLVWRFRERVGGSMGVESPAAVGFHLYLIDVGTGAIIWKDGFQETQRSLSENILNAPAFFKRGAKWLTAAELADSGVEQIFEKMPF